MSINLNGAEPQREMGVLIPSGTIAPAIISVRGRKDTNAGDGVMLDCEITISDGEFDKRKLWDMMMIEGNGGEGHTKAVEITMSRVRAIVESAYGIEPEDASDEAVAARDLDDWEDIDGLEVLVKIGIEKDKTGQYPDKNKIVAFITADSDDYEGFVPASPGGKKAAPAKKVVAKKAPAKKAPAKAASGEAKKPSWA
jgi:hypothetical protein